MENPDVLALQENSHVTVSVQRWLRIAPASLCYFQSLSTSSVALNMTV